MRFSSTRRCNFSLALWQIGDPSPSMRSKSSFGYLRSRNRSRETVLGPIRSFSGHTFDLHFRSMSTNTSEEEREGEQIYQQALRLMQSVKEADNEKEQERSNRMYKAYQKSKERELNPKSQGVTVVKTLVKEVRNDRTNADDEKDEAIRLLKQAANEYDHPEAAIQLGNMLLKSASRSLNRNGKQNDGLDPKDSVAEAMELFRRAGDAGSRVGWYNLGHLLWTGFPPVVNTKAECGDQNDSAAAGVGENCIVVDDMKEAMNAFDKAIELGDSDAMYLVGVHRLGEDDLKSYRNGIDLIERAADTEHDGALYYLALLHLNGDPEIGLEPCSLNEFVTRLDRAVAAGNVEAKFVRANSFYWGTEGYPQDFKRALDDFLQAADEGHADAAVSAGAMFHNGVGVLKDHRKAFELYQLGGELGSKEGWINVVDCWQQGLGVPRSKETARYIKETMLKEKK